MVLCLLFHDNILTNWISTHQHNRKAFILFASIECIWFGVNNQIPKAMSVTIMWSFSNAQHQQNFVFLHQNAKENASNFLASFHAELNSVNGTQDKTQIIAFLKMYRWNIEMSIVQFSYLMNMKSIDGVYKDQRAWNIRCTVKATPIRRSVGSSAALLKKIDCR